MFNRKLIGFAIAVFFELFGPPVASSAVVIEDGVRVLETTPRGTALPYPLGGDNAEKHGVAVLIPIRTNILAYEAQAYRSIEKLELPFFSALPTQPPREIIANLMAEGPVTTQGNTAYRTSFADWYADYIGSVSTDPTIGPRLKRLYRVAINHANENANVVNQIPPARKVLISRAERLVDFLVEERNILSGQSDAQIVRYGMVLPSISPNVSKANVRSKLAGDALRFLTGTYLKESTRLEATVGSAIRAPFPTRKGYKVSSDRVGTFRVVPQSSVNGGGISTPSSSPGWITCLSGESWLSKEDLDPVIVGLRDRVFVAEHPVTGPDWQDAGLPALYHTSLLVGRWYLRQSTQVTYKHVCGKDGSRLNSSTQEVARTTIETPTFLSWVMAHGGIGSYEPDDTLREVLAYDAYGPNALEILDHKTFGTSTDSNSAQCRSRFGAYPIGIYGRNFVCHQAINVFAFIKWGIVPVSYIWSDNLFGSLGTHGSADITNECKCLGIFDVLEMGRANHACIPGVGCCDSWVPTVPTGGDGYNLSRGWHSGRGRDVDTEFRYKVKVVGIAGWDEPPYEKTSMSENPSRPQGKLCLDGQRGCGAFGDGSFEQCVDLSQQCP